MKAKNRIVFIAIMFLLFGATSLISSEDVLASLSMFKPKKIEKEFRSLGIKHKQAYEIGKNIYVLTGEDDKEVNENDYGVRLFVIEGDKLIYRSKGGMDSWYLDLTFFRLNDSDNRILILAESGDEGGSYGFSVYELRNSKVKDIGYISATVYDDEEYLLSAVPYVQIVEHLEGYIFTFTRDVTVQDDKTYDYETINKNSIRYTYDGKDDINQIIE